MASAWSRWTVLPLPCTPSCAKGAAAATSPCPSSSRPPPWSAGAARARHWPVPGSVLKPGALACDLMYGPAAAPFLQWAREHGAVGRDGLGMLVEQAAEAFLLWRGVRPPSAQVLAELRAELAA